MKAAAPASFAAYKAVAGAIRCDGNWLASGKAKAGAFNGLAVSGPAGMGAAGHFSDDFGNVFHEGQRVSERVMKHPRR